MRRLNLSLLLGGFAYCYTFFRGVVCLSVVFLSHSCFCINFSPGLHAILQKRGPGTHFVRRESPILRGSEDFGGQTSSQNMHFSVLLTRT